MQSTWKLFNCLNIRDVLPHLRVSPCMCNSPCISFLPLESIPPPPCHVLLCSELRRAKLISSFRATKASGGRACSRSAWYVLQSTDKTRLCERVCFVFHVCRELSFLKKAKTEIAVASKTRSFSAISVSCERQLAQIDAYLPAKYFTAARICDSSCRGCFVDAARVLERLVNFARSSRGPATCT